MVKPPDRLDEKSKAILIEYVDALLAELKKEHRPEELHECYLDYAGEFCGRFAFKCFGCDSGKVEIISREELSAMFNIMRCLGTTNENVAKLLNEIADALDFRALPSKSAWAAILRPAAKAYRRGHE